MVSETHSNSKEAVLNTITCMIITVCFASLYPCFHLKHCLKDLFLCIVPVLSDVLEGAISSFVDVF